MSSASEWISTTASTISAFGVIAAFWQLRNSKRIAQLEFEDSLAKEYRDIISRIPTRALLGERLSGTDYQTCFDELFHYLDLSNEQVFLRQRKRVSLEVWEFWLDGIKANLALPTFIRAWDEIKRKGTSFQELRRLEEDKFMRDPATWEKR
jgi:hypothetical protein